MMSDFLNSTVNTKTYNLMSDEHQIITITDKEAIVENIGTIVSGDTNSCLLTFEINRFQDGIDLSDKKIRFNYRNSNGKFYDIAVNVKYNDDVIRFSWLLPYSLTQPGGNVIASIEFYGFIEYDEEYSYKTKNFKLSVEKSLGVDDGSDESYNNWTIRIENDVEAIQKKISEIEKDVKSINVPTKLSEMADDAEHRTVSDSQIRAWNEVQKNAQSDWNEKDTDSGAYIKNKPLIPKVTNDLTDELKSNYDEAVTNSHVHNNKSVIDAITDEKVSSWDNKSEFDGNYSSLKGIPNDIATKTYVNEKIKNKVNDSDLAAVAKTGSYNDLNDIPDSLPASDVYQWAKQPEKPTYTADEVGALPDTTQIPSINDVNKNTRVRHEHSNKTILDSIDDQYTEKWNNAYYHSISSHAPENAQENVIEDIKINGVSTAIIDKTVNITTPTKTSDITNDSGFITNITNDLVNYYLKSEVYTKEEVQSLIGRVSSLELIKVDALPIEDIKTSAIYLLPKDQIEKNNIYTEYIYMDGKWETIGDTSVDLSQYVLKEDLVGKLDKPETAPAIGKILKVTEVNEDGTFTCEWADGGGAVEDVQINGASIVGDGVATIPILKRGKFGLPFIEAIDSSRESNGIDVDDHFGNIKVIPSPTWRIDGRNTCTVITPPNLDYAVKAAMCDGKGEAWTADEQAAARERMGIPSGALEPIDDSVTSPDKTWSSQKISDELEDCVKFVKIAINLIGSEGNVPLGNTVYVYETVNEIETLSYSTACPTGAITVRVQRGVQYRITASTDAEGFYSPTEVSGVAINDSEATIRYTELAYPKTVRDLHTLAKMGLVADIVSIGDEFSTTYIYDGNEFEMLWIVTNIKDVEFEDGSTGQGVYLEAKYCTIESIQFDAPHQEVATEETAIEGLYYIGRTDNTYTLLSLSAGDTIPYSDYTYVYHDTIRDTSLNIYKYGHNRVQTSALRQWLNSDADKGAWWTAPKTGYCPPSQLNSIKGFMAGLSQEFIDCVAKVKRTYYTNSVTDGSVIDVLYDKFFSATGTELYGSVNDNEGTYFPYYKEVTGLSAPSNSQNTGRIKYALNAKISSQDCWAFSSNRGFSYYVWRRYAAGQLNNNNANNSYRAVPD